MKVLIVNTHHTSGGAAVAALRLLRALNRQGVRAKMLVSDKDNDDINVVELKSGLRHQWHFLRERWSVYRKLHLNKGHLFDIDIANSGTDITRLPEFREADIIHLSWINQGMLSLNNIRKILASGKPVVWTMHDMWPATAICHLTLGCNRFRSQCMQCKYLPHPGDNDTAAKVWKRKQQMLQKGNITFVACSRWLEGEAKSSALLKGKDIVSIPNPIDTSLFCPGSQQEAREVEQLPTDKRLLLFVCQKVTNPNKGMNYLIEACNKLAEQHPEMKENTGVIILGGHAEEVAEELPFASYPMGYVSDEKRIVNIYRAADVFVMPSLSENLPNTIMEAMACGVPCVGFRVGGIPEMIDHTKNGYVAKLRDADDLAKGIGWVLNEADKEKLTAEAVKKVHTTYSQNRVGMKYIELYNHLLALRHYIL